MNKLTRVKRLVRARDLERQIAAGETFAAHAGVTHAAQAVDTCAQALQHTDNQTALHLRGSIDVNQLDTLARARMAAHVSHVRAGTALGLAKQTLAQSQALLQAAEAKVRQSEKLRDGVRDEVNAAHERKLQAALDDFSLRKVRS